MSQAKPFIDRTLLGLNSLHHVLSLVLRLWVAKDFFMSGLTKIQSWQSTLALFEYEYAVPVLPPTLAAWLATATELVIPVLLVVGLGTRFSAAILFTLNFVAVISYPEISAAGVKDHIIWGLMMVVLIVHGPGVASLDYWLYRRFFKS